MRNDVLIVPLAEVHLDACARIAIQAPDPWSRANLEKAEDGGAHRAFVALQNGAVAGFACFLCTPGNADLQQVVVDEACRRQGVARQLLQAAFARLAALGAERVLLELRASNHGALALYEALGFKALARRPGMYSHPSEDGLLMGMALPGNQAAP